MEKKPQFYDRAQRKQKGDNKSQTAAQEEGAQTILGEGDPTCFGLEPASSGRVLRVWADSLPEDPYGHYLLMLDGELMRNVVVLL